MSFFRKLGWLARRRARENDLTAELEFHLQEEAEEQLAAGMSEQDALRAAQRHLGNLPLVREDTRTAWSWTLLEQRRRHGVMSQLLGRPYRPMRTPVKLDLKDADGL